MIDIFADKIKDEPTREALQKLVAAMNSYPWLLGKWFFLEVNLISGNNTITHQLGFKPVDAILLSQTGTATVTFNYDNFTTNTIQMTASAATKVRILYGEYIRG